LGTQPLTSYVAADTCGAGANETSIAAYLWPGFFANVLVSGLAPGTRYYYTVGSLDGGFATEASFVTAKALGPDVPVRLATYGDMALSLWDGAMGTVEEVIRLHDATADGGLDTVLHFGDLGYAEGSTVVWELWHSYIASATRKIPYHVSQGNHGEWGLAAGLISCAPPLLESVWQ
jgi:phosphodiesterase/alkaline phosphatase D-like protein